MIKSNHHGADAIGSISIISIKKKPVCSPALDGGRLEKGRTKEIKKRKEMRREMEKERKKNLINETSPKEGYVN